LPQSPLCFYDYSRNSTVQPYLQGTGWLSVRRPYHSTLIEYGSWVVLLSTVLTYMLYELRSSKFFRLIRRVVDYFLDYTEGTL
jgi:hypothetical protein